MIYVSRLITLLLICAAVFVVYWCSQFVERKPEPTTEVAAGSAEYFRNLCEQVQVFDKQIQAADNTLMFGTDFGRIEQARAQKKSAMQLRMALITNYNEEAGKSSASFLGDSLPKSLDANHMVTQCD